ncbi:MAG TPA: PEGA domain-containing protein [Polyangiaceae bacterium]|nr:PEGA domain-containing protein [Polyangiaceae bacterium]
MRASTLALVLTALTTTPLAVAKPSGTVVQHAEPTSAPTEEASFRFQRGVSLYKERSYDAALAEFNRAYELAPDYRVLYNIAQVQAERGDFVAAVKCFRQYLQDGGTAISDTRSTEVRAEIARLQARIAELHVAANVDGAELLIDGEPVGTLPMAAIPVNAGARRITLRKKGYEVAERRLMLTGGETTTLQLTLQNEPGALPNQGTKVGTNAQSLTQAPSGDSSNPGLWISLAAVGVAGTATAVFGVLTRRTDDQLSDELNRYPASPSSIDDKRRQLKQLTLLTDGCGALTLIGLGATIYFAATGKTSVEPKRSQLMLQTSPMSLGVRGAGWQVTGQF